MAKATLNNPISRALPALGALLFALVVAGCSEQETATEVPPSQAPATETPAVPSPAKPAAPAPYVRKPPSELGSKYQIPELRLAGVDLEYALRRISSSADIILLLDEIRPRETGWDDLGFERIDLDLPAGSVQDALETLRELLPGAFDYEFEEGLLFVRSLKSIDEQTVLDAKTLPKSDLAVDMPGLITWMNGNLENAYLRAGKRRGQPVYKRVQVAVPEAASAMDVFRRYAVAVGRSLKVRRAGYSFEERQAPPGQQFVVSNTLGMMAPYPKPVLLPRMRWSRSAIYALASMSDRLGTPICVLDRSALLLNLGSLNYRPGLDTGAGLEETLKSLSGQERQGIEPAFTWKENDGLIEVVSRQYSYFLPGQDLLAEQVKGGSFEGTLGELTRWLNRNRSQPSNKYLMGGEIPPDAKTAKLEIQEGATIREVLLQFARASGQCWNLNLRDAKLPTQPVEGTWVGAFVTPISEWGANGLQPMN